MSERGRKPGFRMTDEHRVKIQNSNILNALIEHAVGEREMSATQVSAGLGLLRKVLPDLSATTIGGDEENPITYKEVGTAYDVIASRISSIAARANVEEDTGGPH